MIRSPFFYIFILLFVFSCKEKTKTNGNNNQIKEQGLVLRDKAIAQLEAKNYNNAFYYFNKSKITYEKIKDSANIIFNLAQMASIQQINGDYYGSKETLTEALPYVKKKDIYSAAINNLYGIADKELFIYDSAIHYYNEALKDSNDDVAKLSPLNNIAVLYTLQKKYDKAIAILESVLTQKEISKKSRNRVLDNLGFAYFKKGQNEKGLALMNESLTNRKQSGDSYGSIASNLHLAEYYADKNSQKSNQYALEAYQTSTELRSIDERLDALSFLITNKSGAGNPEYAQKFVFLNDSIIKIRNNFKNKFAKIKYDSKKEKEENQKLRLQKAENEAALQQSENEKILFLSGFIILGLVLFFVSKNHENKKRIIKLETAYDTETRIAKDIHDELANDVFNSITFAQTQSLTNTDVKENLIQKLNHIYTRVRGVSRENSEIDTKANYSINLKEMLSTYNSENTNVIINGIEKVNWDVIDDIKKVAIYRVLQELMVNMKKHSDAPLVVVKFESNGKTAFIDYTDNGKGCEKSKIIKNGLQNMENRILAIKGTITFDTEPNKGFKVKISMPK
ncbi:tetratricopeptide repeat-containing sensor histidine kinase [Flavobacterium branchiicola]|uniref:histidine kinase n=1 Tax=Flavobacterium branchiicola TaxID=1114875 RepID=A0ABV9PFE0_9FLAO|nr:tetratricopeptide repeat-containing sensor histidine kinase [Flavobacterium branchiicola]MBS7254544.1 ATP-binding protein [Flavobacterium branchiicola]